MSQNTREDAPAGRKALALEGLTPEALYLEGTQYFKARDYESACACFEHYATVKPDDASGQYFLARVYYHQNKYFDRAEECIKRAIELDPSSETPT
jgi:tetratricopeptide (TPR) repeat protein